MFFQKFDAKQCVRTIKMLSLFYSGSLISENLPVLVHLSYCNKNTRGWLAYKQQKFLAVPEAGKYKIKVLANLGLGRACFLIDRHLLTVTLHGKRGNGAF